jgi:hypothetical protein
MSNKPRTKKDFEAKIDAGNARTKASEQARALKPKGNKQIR